MPAPPPDATSLRGEVVRVVPAGPEGTDGVILTVRPERELPPIRASRFFMLKALGGSAPFLPRPFSIYRQREENLEFLVKVMGRGTRSLARAAPGSTMLLNGPLGNGWPTLDGGGAPWVCLAGGVGSAPFPLAIEQALAGMDGAPPCAPDELTVVFGAATAAQLYDLEAFTELGVRVALTTDDGSQGFHGNVLQRLEQLWEAGELPREVRLLACGPEAMLRAVEDLALARDLDAWLSLETTMACGVGICNGCPVATRPDGPLGAWPNAKCCVEGPVFPARAITLHEVG